MAADPVQHTLNGVEDDVRRSILASKESNFINVVSREKAEDLLKYANRKFNRVSVTIREKLDITEENILNAIFPEFNIEFQSTIATSHPLAAATRKLMNRVLVEKPNVFLDDSKARKEFLKEQHRDVLFKDFGGNFNFYLLDNTKDFHVCCPELDVKDHQRFSDRFLLVSKLRTQTANLDSNRSEVIGDFDKVVNDPNAITRSICRHRGQNCNITSVYGILQDSNYDYPIYDLADSLSRAKITTLYGAYIFHPDMLMHCEGFIDDLKISWEHLDKNKKRLATHDDKTANKSYAGPEYILKHSKYIKFSFLDDGSQAYIHKSSTYLSYAFVSTFTDTNRKITYFFERLERRGGYQVFRITGTPIVGYPKQVYSLNHDLYNESTKNNYIIKTYKYNQDAYHKGCKRVYPRFEGDVSLLTPIEFVAPASIVDKTMQFARGVTETKFKPEEIFNFAKSINSRSPTSVGIARPKEMLNTFELQHLSLAVYIYMYQNKYDQGKVIQQIIHDVNRDRNSSPLSLAEVVLKMFSLLIFSSSSKDIKLPHHARGLTWYNSWLYKKQLSGARHDDLVTLAPVKISVVSSETHVTKFVNSVGTVVTLEVPSAKELNVGEDLHLVEDILKNITKEVYKQNNEYFSKKCDLVEVGLDAISVYSDSISDETSEVNTIASRNPDTTYMKLKLQLMDCKCEDESSLELFDKDDEMIIIDLPRHNRSLVKSHLHFLLDTKDELNDLCSNLSALRQFGEAKKVVWFFDPYTDIDNLKLLTDMFNVSNNIEVHVPILMTQYHIDEFIDIFMTYNLVSCEVKRNGCHYKWLMKFSNDGTRAIDTLSTLRNTFSSRDTLLAQLVKMRLNCIDKDLQHVDNDVSKENCPDNSNGDTIDNQVSNSEAATAQPIVDEFYMRSIKTSIDVLTELDNDYLPKLNEVKSKLTKYDNKNFKQVCDRINNISAEKGKHISRAYYKIEEIYKVLNLARYLEGRPYVFVADICSGPGGFSEFILTNSSVPVHLINITKLDFIANKTSTLNASVKNSQSSWHQFLGSSEKGDILDVDTRMEFLYHCQQYTNNYGCTLVFCDGSVDNNSFTEDQEIANIPLIVTEIFMSLHILAEGGVMVLKTFTMESDALKKLFALIAGLFQRISITKPHSSRPTNSERYVVFEGFMRGQIDEFMRQFLYWGIRNDTHHLLDLKYLTDYDVGKTDIISNIQLVSRELADKQIKAIDRVLGEIDSGQPSLNIPKPISATTNPVIDKRDPVVLQSNGVAIESKLYKIKPYQTLFPTPGDGNCCYYAVNQCRRTDTDHIRSLLSNYSEDKSFFYDKDGNPELGNTVVIELYARLTKSRITLWNTVENTIVKFIPLDGFLFDTEIVYTGNHYDYVSPGCEKQYERCGAFAIETLPITEDFDFSSYELLTLNHCPDHLQCDIDLLRRTIERKALRFLCETRLIAYLEVDELYCYHMQDHGGVTTFDLIHDKTITHKFSTDVSLRETGYNKMKDTVTYYVVSTDGLSISNSTQLESSIKNVFPHLPQAVALIDTGKFINIDFIVRLFKSLTDVVRLVPKDPTPETFDTPSYIPGITELSNFRNAMSEAKFAWMVGRKNIINNIDRHHSLCVTYLKNSGRNSYTVDDPTFGLLDTQKREWVITPVEILDYDYAYDGKDLIEVRGCIHPKGFSFSTDRFSTRYLSVSKDTRIVNTDRIYAVVEKVSEKTIMNYKYKIELIEGVPGAGKTHYILTNHNPSEDLVLTHTREAAEDIRRRAKSGNYCTDEEALKQNYRTSDSYLLHRSKNKRYKRVWLDEALMKHTGEWGWIQLLTGCELLCVLGDSAQIPFINRTSTKMHYDTLKKVFDKSSNILSVNYITTSRRCPRDIIAWMNFEKKYDFKVMTDSLVDKSVACELIGSIADIPAGLETKSVKFLTFTQSEKNELIKLRNYDVSTIHEFQGSQSAVIYIVRSNNKHNSIYDSKEHMLVALSRHTKNFKYYSVKEDALFKEIVKIKNYGVGQVKKFFLASAGGYFVNVSRPYVFDAEMDDGRAVVLYKQSTVARNFVQLHGGDGYVSPIPKIYPHVVDYSYVDPVSDFVPIYDVSCPINVLQNFIDIVIPGSSVEFDDYDVYQFLHSSEILESPELRLREEFSVPKISPDVMLPKLRATVPRAVRCNQRELVKAFLERNGNVPQLSETVDVLYEAEKMCERFVDKYIGDKELFARYKDTLIKHNVSNLTSWLETQPPFVADMIRDTDVDIFLKTDRNVYDYLLKRVAKIDMEVGSQFRFKSPQTIAHQCKEINAYFCPLVKDIKDRLFAVLKPNVLINMDRSPRDFDEALSHAMSRYFPDGNHKHLEIDFSKFDKSQNILTLTYEVFMMRRLGIPPDVCDLWVAMHSITTLLNRSCRFAATVSYQRKSGDAMTYLGNTLFLMGVMAATFDYGDDCVMLFSGDDSLIFMPTELPDEELLNMTYKCSYVYNLEAKLLRFKTPYFCSKYIVNHNNYYYSVPDLVKSVVKLGRKDLVSFEHVEQYRVSMADNLQNYYRSELYDLITEAVCDRSKVSIDVGIFVCAILHLLKSKEEFFTLFEINPDYEDLEFSNLPSIDI